MFIWVSLANNGCHRAKSLKNWYNQGKIYKYHWNRGNILRIKEKYMIKKLNDKKTGW